MGRLTRRLIGPVLGTAVACLPPAASAGQMDDGGAPATAASPTVPHAPWRAPVLTTERYNEDWSMLADPARRSGRWIEPFKYLPLNGTGEVYLTTGVELRARYEGYRNNGWGAAEAPDDGYVWKRALPYADLHAGSVRAFVQPIFAYASGVKPSPGPIDRTNTDLLQGFADALFQLDGEATLRLRAGRELLGFGSERLVGTRYGPNVLLAFDGGRAILHHGALTANVFYVRPVEPGPHAFDDRHSPTRALWGLYTTWMFANGGIDLYYLGYRNDRASFEQGTGREQRHTLGSRVFGASGGWHWNLEGMAQGGHFDGLPIRAWSLATELGRGLASLPFAPDITVRADIASGDRSPDDHRLDTFNALFPKGKYFGELSPIGPYNIINLQAGISFTLAPRVQFGLLSTLYWRQSRGDGIYDMPGHLERPGNDSEARFIGRETELSLAWDSTPELSLSGSVSEFRPGAFIHQTGPAHRIGMVGLEANFRF
jgi:hypothetical protein